MATLRLVAFTAFALPCAAAVGGLGGIATAQSSLVQPQRDRDEMRFRGMDVNGDGVITRAEWRGSAQSFRMHDWNGDGILSGDEVRPGAGRDDDREDRFEYLDVNRNGRLEPQEWHGSRDAFEWLDRNGDNLLSRAEVVGPARHAFPNATGGAVGTSGQSCLASAPRVVDDVYQQVLERPADEASAGLTQKLAAGQMTVRDVVAHVAKSPEHAERFYWQPLVSAVYEQILQREPSQPELQEATSTLASGRLRLLDFVARTAARAANGEEGAVRILYRRLLGREADSAGLRYFTDVARRDGIEAVARDIVASPEYRRRAGADGVPREDIAAHEAAVRALYRHVLGRDPDPQGLRHLTQIAATRGFDTVVDRMVTSPEYERLYGDDEVPGRDVRYCGPTM